MNYAIASGIIIVITLLLYAVRIILVDDRAAEERRRNRALRESHAEQDTCIYCLQTIEDDGDGDWVHKATRRYSCKVSDPLWAHRATKTCEDYDVAQAEKWLN
jgi:hypothetical protein